MVGPPRGLIAAIVNTSLPTVFLFLRQWNPSSSRFIVAEAIVRFLCLFRQTSRRFTFAYRHGPASGNLKNT